DLDDWVLAEIREKLKQFQVASYYEILGVDRQASSETIRRAYYDLELMLESFRARWPARHEMNRQLNDLLATISRAYQTLIDPNRRREYDTPAGGRRDETERRNGAAGESARRSQSSPAAGAAATSRPGRPVPLPLPKPIPIPLPVVPVAAPAAHL